MHHLTPSQKGAVAEAGITSMVIQLGLTVLRSAIHLRLEPTRNNQEQGIKWARDYELASGIERLRPGPRPPLILPERGRLHFQS